MPRALPSNPDLIIEDPGPLERFSGFPHTIEVFPLDELRLYGGFSLLLPPSSNPRPDNLPTPSEPEAAL